MHTVRSLTCFVSIVAWTPLSLHRLTEYTATGVYDYAHLLRGDCVSTQRRHAQVLGARREHWLMCGAMQRSVFQTRAVACVAEPDGIRPGCAVNGGDRNSCSRQRRRLSIHTEDDVDRLDNASACEIDGCERPCIRAGARRRVWSLVTVHVSTLHRCGCS
jgi:hypothetical protein